jgi:lipopolysaccharide export LptBFGC system permease protein LptF
VRRLRAIDCFQIATTVLFVALGATIIVRSARAGVWMGCVVGAVMFAFGVYRWSAIVRALREVRR